MADDDELAERVLRLRRTGPAEKRSEVPLASWNDFKELNASIQDAASVIRRAIYEVNTPKGKKPPTMKPARRPITAQQRAERRAEVQKHRSLVAKVLPKS